MDLILSIRQMMAESKFFEAQCESHTQLLLNPDYSNSRMEFIELHLQSLLAQEKALPSALLLEFIEYQISKNIFQASEWLEKFDSRDQKKFLRRILLIRIQLAEKNGQLDELYQLLSEFQIYLFEARAPVVPELINAYAEKYFRGDFHLKLQRLALHLMLGDILTAEDMIKDLILSCVEKSSPKGTKEKLSSLRDVLLAHEIGQLEIYKNYCSLIIDGIKDKKDFKKIAEIVIYLDHFKFQVLVLDLLVRFDLEEEALSYAKEVKKNINYDFVYLDKYFNHLKSFFIQKKSDPVVVDAPLVVDLQLRQESTVQSDLHIQYLADNDEDEKNLYHVLKYQDYSANELTEIAVSFLQSDFPKVALQASDLALKKSLDDKTYLKACYLKLTCLLQLGDYRAALDLTFIALGKSQSQDDVLSFMYGQAEAYLKLKQHKQARHVLKKIISIDSNYRMAKERLDKINEI